jgi:hypothetical protein
MATSPLACGLQRFLIATTTSKGCRNLSVIISAKQWLKI